MLEKAEWANKNEQHR